MVQYLACCVCGRSESFEAVPGPGYLCVAVLMADPPGPLSGPLEQVGVVAAGMHDARLPAGADEEDKEPRLLEPFSFNADTDDNHEDDDDTEDHDDPFPETLPDNDVFGKPSRETSVESELSPGSEAVRDLVGG